MGDNPRIRIANGYNPGRVERLVTPSVEPFQGSPWVRTVPWVSPTAIYVVPLQGKWEFGLGSLLRLLQVDTSIVDSCRNDVRISFSLLVETVSARIS